MRPTGPTGSPGPSAPATHVRHPIGGGQGGGSLPFPNGQSPSGAQLFDPYGSGSGDHPGAVNLATDGDPSTAWTTANYPHGLNRPGVGIQVDMLANTAYSELGLLTRTPGFDVEIYGSAATSPPAKLSGWKLIGRQGSVGSRQKIPLDDKSLQARFYLVWITRLPAGSGHAGLSEISLIG